MAWGALMGLGKGLSGVSSLLGEKRKMDWEAQQQEVAHQRNLALEDLRNRNASSRQQAGFAHTEEMYALGKADQLARDKQLQAAQLDRDVRLKQEQTARDKMLREQRREDKTWEIEQEHEAAKRQIALAEEAADSQTKKKFQAIDDSKMLTDKQKEMLKLEVVTGVKYRDQKGKEVPYEQRRLAVEKGIEMFEMLDNKDKKRLSNQANQMDPSIDTIEEVAVWYGKYYADQIFGTTAVMPGDEEPTKTRKTPDQIADDIIAGKVTKEEVKGLPESAQAVIINALEKKTGYGGDFQGVNIRVPSEQTTALSGPPEPKTWGKGMSIDKWFSRLKSDREKQKAYLERQ